MKTHNSHRRLTGLLLSAWLASPAPLHAVEFPWTPRYQYSVYIPQTSRNDVAPGDYVEIGVVSGPDDHRERRPIAKKARVTGIADPVRNHVAISIALTRHDMESLYQMMAEPAARVYVRIVQKNSRPEPYAAAASDGVPDMDFEKDEPFAKNPATLLASPNPE